MEIRIDDEDLEADLKLRDSCSYMDEGEVWALGSMSALSLVTAILLIWWYTSGAASADRETPS